jgi:hypothetical protein
MKVKLKIENLINYYLDLLIEKRLGAGEQIIVKTKILLIFTIL